MKGINKIFKPSIVIYFLLFIFLSVSITEPVYSKKKTKTSQVSKKKKTKSKSSKKRTKRSKKTKKSRKKTNEPASAYFLADTILAPGIIYQNAIVTIHGSKHSVHVLKSDLKNKKSEIEVLKANSNNTELAKLQEIYSNYNNADKSRVLVGAVNANFWKAYSNYPIGPMMVDGELVEMPTYKQWSSALISDMGEPFIGNYVINGNLKTRSARVFDISSVNRRTDSIGCVLYNKFGGDTIPFITSKKANEIFIKGLDNVDFDSNFDDSTEAGFDIDKYKRELISAQRVSMKEYSLPKITVKYINKPGLNRNVVCRVTSLDTCAVAVPKNGCIISFGKDSPIETIPQQGDTIMFRFSTNINKNVEFEYAVSGTPRLVRDGKAKHEAYLEGSKGKRFINGNLSRTAIGFDKEKENFYIVTIEPSGRTEGCIGASLTQLSEIMDFVGCYNAMNLDGGGSTIMVINGKNVMSRVDSSSSRRISAGIGIKALKP